MKFYYAVQFDGEVRLLQPLGIFRTYLEAETAAHQIMKPGEIMHLYVPGWHFSLFKSACACREESRFRLVRTLVTGLDHRVHLLRTPIKMAENGRSCNQASPLQKAS